MEGLLGLKKAGSVEPRDLVYHFQCVAKQLQRDESKGYGKKGKGKGKKGKSGQNGKTLSPKHAEAFTWLLNEFRTHLPSLWSRQLTQVWWSLGRTISFVSDKDLLKGFVDDLVTGTVAQLTAFDSDAIGIACILWSCARVFTTNISGNSNSATCISASKQSGEKRNSGVENKTPSGEGNTSSTSTGNSNNSSGALTISKDLKTCLEHMLNVVIKSRSDGKGKGKKGEGKKGHGKKGEGKGAGGLNINLQDCSNSLWAMAKLDGKLDSKIIRNTGAVFFVKGLELLKQPTEQKDQSLEIANIVYAVGSLGLFGEATAEQQIEFTNLIKWEALNFEPSQLAMVLSNFPLSSPTKSGFKSKIESQRNQSPQSQIPSSSSTIPAAKNQIPSEKLDALEALGKATQKALVKGDKLEMTPQSFAVIYSAWAKLYTEHFRESPVIKSALNLQELLKDLTRAALTAFNTQVNFFEPRDVAELVGTLAIVQEDKAININDKECKAITKAALELGDKDTDTEKTHSKIHDSADCSEEEKSLPALLSTYFTNRYVEFNSNDFVRIMRGFSHLTSAGFEMNESISSHATKKVVAYLDLSNLITLAHSYTSSGWSISTELQDAIFQAIVFGISKSWGDEGDAGNTAAQEQLFKNFSPQTFSMLIYTLGRMSKTYKSNSCSPGFLSILSALFKKVDGLCTKMNAKARKGKQPCEISFTSQHVANCFWGLATLDLQLPLNIAVDHARNIINLLINVGKNFTMKDADLGNCLWGLANIDNKILVSHHYFGDFKVSLLSSFKEHLVQENGEENAKPLSVGQISYCVWALGKFCQVEKNNTTMTEVRPFFEGLVKTLAISCEKITESSFGMAMWGLATLLLKDTSSSDLTKSLCEPILNWLKKSSEPLIATASWQTLAHIDFFLEQCGVTKSKSLEKHMQRRFDELMESIETKSQQTDMQSWCINGVVEELMALSKFARTETNQNAMEDVEEKKKTAHMLLLDCPETMEKELKNALKTHSVKAKIDCWNRFRNGESDFGENKDKKRTYDAVIIRGGSSRASLQTLLKTFVTSLTADRIYVLSTERENTGIHPLLGHVNNALKDESHEARLKLVTTKLEKSNLLMRLRILHKGEESLDSLANFDKNLLSAGKSSVYLYGGPAEEDVSPSSTVDSEITQKKIAASTASPELQELAKSLDLGPKWEIFPGLFAGGGLDVMTAYLLTVMKEKIDIIPALKSKNALRLLDFCCGSGTIGKALHHLATVNLSRADTHVGFLDNDLLAIEACRKNCAKIDSSSFSYHLSDRFKCFSQIKKSNKYHMIVSNPPVHFGVEDNFTVLREMIRFAPDFLQKSGELWLVAQNYIPVRRVFRESSSYSEVHCYSNSRFCVWRAVKREDAEVNTSGVIDDSLEEPPKKKRKKET